MMVVNFLSPAKKQSIPTKFALVSMAVVSEGAIAKCQKLTKGKMRFDVDHNNLNPFLFFP